MEYPQYSNALVRSRPDRTRPPRGVTLVELLIVITIMSALALLVIPQVRTISRERGMREAARTVQAVFEEASSRARSEGFAAVVIARNTNFYRYVNNTATPLDPVGEKVYYHGATLYQMRLPPAWTGNQDNAAAWIADYPASPRTDDFHVRVEAPYDSRIVIEPGSWISFGRSPVRYRILGSFAAPGPGCPAVNPADPPQTDLICVRDSFAPDLVAMGVTSNTFTVRRRPEVVLDSAVSLPRGYFINLNYSGAIDVPRGGGLPDLDANDYTWTDLVQKLPVVDRTAVDPVYAAANVLNPVAYPQYVDVNSQPVVITFGSRGGIDRIYPNGMFVDAWVEASRPLNPAQYPPALNLFRTQYMPTGAFTLCIAADEFENSFPLTGTYATANDLMPLSWSRASRDLLSGTESQWVSVDCVSGAVAVSATREPQTYKTMALGAAPLDTWSGLQAMRILESRGFALDRRMDKD